MIDIIHLSIKHYSIPSSHCWKQKLKKNLLTTMFLCFLVLFLNLFIESRNAAVVVIAAAMFLFCSSSSIYNLTGGSLVVNCGYAIVMCYSNLFIKRLFRSFFFQHVQLKLTLNWLYGDETTLLFDDSTNGKFLCLFNFFVCLFSSYFGLRIYIKLTIK